MLDGQMLWQKFWLWERIPTNRFQFCPKQRKTMLIRKSNQKTRTKMTAKMKKM